MPGIPGAMFGSIFPALSEALLWNRSGPRLSAPFSGGETYRVRVWRDGGHSIDTYPDDVSFVSLEVSWSREDELLQSYLYRVYSLTRD